MVKKMRLHDLFFWLSAFFLLGVLLGSATNNFAYKIFWTLGTVIILGVFLKLKDPKTSWLLVIGYLLLVVTGATYFYLFDYFQQHPTPVFNQKIKFNALVIQSDLKISGQELIVRAEPSKNVLKISTFRYPIFNYGDYVQIVGAIHPPFSEFLNGEMFRPKIDLLESGRGWWVKSQLVKLRNNFKDNLKKVLPYDQAVFLSGLTLGGHSEFSKEMEDKFRQSGTLHLIALSGFNITIIINYLGGFFNFFFSRRKTLWLSTIFIFLFVLMTGAEASIMRAAIMGFIMILAQRSGRLFNFRNALVAAALIMTLANPKILVFDLGFQLSFAAMIGIIYLKPWLEKFFRKEFWFKKAILTTIAAEFSVLPILILKFGHASPWGIITNPLLENFIPLTMGLGFLTGVIGFVSYYLSLPLAVLVNILLTYELAVINLFSSGF